MGLGPSSELEPKPAFLHKSQEPPNTGSNQTETKAKVCRAVKSLMTEGPGRAARDNVQKLRDLSFNAVVADRGSVQTNCQTFIQELLENTETHHPETK
jgi:hypothetical protein